MRRDGSLVFHVRESEAGQVLAALLKRWRSTHPPDEVRRLLRDRRVQIDGNVCQDGQRRLKAGEVVKILPHSVAAPPSVADIRVVFVDEQVVVVEKPSGMTTMSHADEAEWTARRRRREPTLEDLLPGVLAAALGPSRHSRASRSRPPRTRLPRIIPVHRLDRDTSGLMVFARTPAAEQSLVAQFREHSIDRAYLAVVPGELTERTIESYFVRDRGDGKRGSVAGSCEGQRAVTHVRPKEFFPGYTLVECRLETGRTHQIRIHLSEAGHPVCGDRVYRGPFGQKPIVDRSGAPRLVLHAAELGFAHPISGERLLFESRLPRELANFVRRLRTAPAT